METIYLITGIVIFWLLRIGLIGVLIYCIYDLNNFRQCITITEKGKERCPNIFEAITECCTKKGSVIFYSIFISVTILDIVLWWTLFI